MLAGPSEGGKEQGCLITGGELGDGHPSLSAPPT
mgnify:CR=1 FL=1